MFNLCLLKIFSAGLSANGNDLSLCRINLTGRIIIIPRLYLIVFCCNFKRIDYVAAVLDLIIMIIVPKILILNDRCSTKTLTQYKTVIAGFRVEIVNSAKNVRFSIHLQRTEISIRSFICTWSIAKWVYKQSSFNNS